MEVWVLGLFAFLRPILMMKVEVRFLGLSTFDLAAMFFIAALMMLLLVRVATGKSFKWAPVDLLIGVYIAWAVAISIVYPEHTDPRALVKWIAPFLTWYVVKNVVSSESQYLRLVGLAIAGYTIPFVVSAIMIGLEMESALTKIPHATKLGIYEGAYANPALLGQSVVLLAILGSIYLIVGGKGKRLQTGQLSAPKLAIFLLALVPALYCLVKSQSRTAMVGIVVFLGLLLLLTNRKWFLFMAASMVLGIALTAPLWSLIFHDFIDVVEGERPVERMGSGRPYMWMHNLSEYDQLPIDRQIAGAGIGNVIEVRTWAKDGGESFWPSHNDLLHVFIWTGPVGLVIFLMIQIAILQRILALPKATRPVFFAAFIAIMVMNFASNSFITRFGLAQFYYLIMAYVDIGALPRSRDSRAKFATTSEPEHEKQALRLS
jgi:hypothetical protein